MVLLLRPWAARSKGPTAQIVVNALKGPFMIWVLILGTHLAMQSSDLHPRATLWIGRGLLALWIMSLTIIGSRLAGGLIRFHGSGIPGALPVTTLTQTLAQLAVVILGLLVLLNLWGVSITPILTALGVGGLAVALALQDTLSNLFGGVYVAVAGQVRLGGYVKLNTGEEGYVTDIGWRCTTFRALANNLVIVPNAKLAQAIVTNYYLPEKRMSASFAVTVGYECDPDAVEKVLAEVLTQAAGEVPGMLAEPAPSAAFDPGFGEAGVGVTGTLDVAEVASQFPVRTELRKRVLRRFRAEGIGIPYPSRTVYLRGSGRKGVRPAEGQGAAVPGPKEI